MKQISQPLILVAGILISGCKNANTWNGHTFDQKRKVATFSDDDNYDSLVEREIDFRKVRVKQVSEDTYEFDLKFNPSVREHATKERYVLVHTDFDLDRDITTGYHFYGIGVDCFASFTKKDGEEEWKFNRMLYGDSKERFEVVAREIKDDESEFKYIISFAKGFLSERGFNFRIRTTIKGKDVMDLSPVYTVKTSRNSGTRRSEQRR